MPEVRKLDTIAASVLDSDEEIRARVKRLVNALLKDAEHTIKFGSPAERAQLMKLIVPPLLKSLQSADVNAGEAAQSAAYERILQAMRGG